MDHQPTTPAELAQALFPSGSAVSTPDGLGYVDTYSDDGTIAVIFHPESGNMEKYPVTDLNPPPPGSLAIFEAHQAATRAWNSVPHPAIYRAMELLDEALSEHFRLSR